MSRATKKERAAAIVALARATYEVEGSVEIDDTDDPVSQLSEGDDNGCYVKAWVWVPFSGTRWDKGE